MATIFWESKDPNDIDDFALDWTIRLKGEQLTAAVWSFVNVTSVVIESSSIASPFAKVRLSGGDENETAILLCRATTSTGRQIDETVKVSIVTA